MDPAVKRETRERRNRAVANNHISLAPLTTRLPLRDDDYDAINSIPPPPHSTSYLQSRSAPATPGLFSGPPTRSPSRSSSTLAVSRQPTPVAAGTISSLPKSKSASYLARNNRNNSNRTRSSQSSLTRRTRSGHFHRTHHNNSSSGNHPATYTTADNLEWLHHVGALLTTEARESKGQGWQVAASRAGSSTGSLPGLLPPLASPHGDFDSPRYREHQEAVVEYFAARHRAREREREARRASAAAAARARARSLTRSLTTSRRGSRDANSFAAAAAAAAATAGGGGGGGGGGGAGGAATAPASAAADRERWDDYFGAAMAAEEEDSEEEWRRARARTRRGNLWREGVVDEAADEAEREDDDGDEGLPGPDFVNLDERIEAAETLADDEAYIRRLARQASGGPGAWLARLFGMKFPDLGDSDDDVDAEDDEEEEEEEEEEGYYEQGADDGLGANKARRGRNEEMLRRLHEGAIVTDLNAPPPVPPPKEDGGFLADAAWLAKLAAKTFFG